MATSGEGKEAMGEGLLSKQWRLVPESQKSYSVCLSCNLGCRDSTGGCLSALTTAAFLVGRNQTAQKLKCEMLGQEEDKSISLAVGRMASSSDLREMGETGRRVNRADGPSGAQSATVESLHSFRVK